MAGEEVDTVATVAMACGTDPMRAAWGQEVLSSGAMFGVTQRPKGLGYNYYTTIIKFNKYIIITLLVKP